MILYLDSAEEALEIFEDLSEKYIDVCLQKSGGSYFITRQNKVLHTHGLFLEKSDENC